MVEPEVVRVLVVRAGGHDTKFVLVVNGRLSKGDCLYVGWGQLGIGAAGRRIDRSEHSKCTRLGQTIHRVVLSFLVMELAQMVHLFLWIMGKKLEYDREKKGKMRALDGIRNEWGMLG